MYLPSKEPFLLRLSRIGEVGGGALRQFICCMRRLFSSPPSVFRPCLRQPLSSSSSHLSLFFIPPPSPSARHTENTDEGRREEEGEEGKKRAGAGNEVRSLLLSPCSSWRRGGRRQQNLLPLSFAQLLTHKSLMKTNVPPASRRRRVGGTVGVGRDPLPFPPSPLFSGPFPILQGLSPLLSQAELRKVCLKIAKFAMRSFT